MKRNAIEAREPNSRFFEIGIPFLQTSRAKIQSRMIPRWLIAAAWTLVFFISANQTSAQMIRTASPFTTVKSSFYERLGIDFGFSLKGSGGNPFADNARGVFGLGPGGQFTRNLNFTQGGVNSAVPAFGGYDPGADATFGYHLRNGGGGYHLGFRFGKGSNRSITNTTPVLMTRNGVSGNLFNGTVSPFVTGIIPVVGNGGYRLPNLGPTQVVSPLELKLRQLHLENRSGYSSSRTPPAKPQEANYTESANYSHSQGSTASQGDLSVKEIKRLKELGDRAKQDKQNGKVAELLRKSEEALASGHDGAARSFLRTAIRYADENQKASLQARLQKLIDEN